MSQSELHDVSSVAGALRQECAETYQDLGKVLRRLHLDMPEDVELKMQVGSHLVHAAFCTATAGKALLQEVQAGRLVINIYKAGPPPEVLLPKTYVYLENIDSVRASLQKGQPLDLCKVNLWIGIPGRCLPWKSLKISENGKVYIVSPA